jgi:hypothetical protein
VYRICKKCIEFKQKGVKNMKIKLFFYKTWKQSIESFEQEVNAFMENVQVVDVKYSEATVGDSEDMGAITGIMILYKETGVN